MAPRSQRPQAEPQRRRTRPPRLPARASPPAQLGQPSLVGLFLLLHGGPPGHVGGVLLLADHRLHLALVLQPLPADRPGQVRLVLGLLGAFFLFKGREAGVEGVEGVVGGGLGRGGFVVAAGGRGGVLEVRGGGGQGGGEESERPVLRGFGGWVSGRLGCNGGGFAGLRRYS